MAPGSDSALVSEARVTELEAEVAWLKEGLEEALERLQDGRVSLAITTIKGTLTKETWG